MQKADGFCNLFTEVIGLKKRFGAVALRENFIPLFAL